MGDHVGYSGHLQQNFHRPEAPRLKAFVLEVAEIKVQYQIVHLDSYYYDKSF